MARLEEMAVIGSVLISPETITFLDKAKLNAEDFLDKEAQTAFLALQELRDSGKPLDDYVLLVAEMGKIAPGEHTAFIAEAMERLPTANNVAEYCNLVKEQSARRRISEAFSNAEFGITLGNWQQAVDEVRDALDAVTVQENDVMDGERLSNSFLAYYRQAKENPEFAYCRTGIADLDHQLGGGMFKSEVYIIGARPGMGKTTLAINIAQSIVNAGKAVLFVSLEMTRQQIQAKRIALETGISYTALLTGRVNADREEDVEAWLDRQKNVPFYLTTNSRLTVGDIGRRARQIPNLAAVIVDYLGLIPVPPDSAKKPRYEQMTEISSDIKALAKSLNVPILALSQLNRENTTRSDKRPTMADLRDSGAIEQDAGAIILLHRPEYYDKKEPGQNNREIIELNVAKNRHAEPGLVSMWWQGTTGRISMLSKMEDPEQHYAEQPQFEEITEEEALPF